MYLMIDFLQLPKFKYVCVYMRVEQLSKQKDPKNVSSYDTICVILMAGV